MSDKLRAMRDGLSRGDDVLVSGHGMRPRRARVVEVLRAAARVRYYDNQSGEVQTVLFKDIKRVTGESIARARAPQTPPPEAATATVVRITEVVEPEPEPQKPNELTAWLDMGRDVLDRLSAEIASLDITEKGLRDEARELFELAEKAASERAELHKKWTTMNTLLDSMGIK